MSTRLDLQEFFIEGRNRAQLHVLLHIAEPTAPHEKPRGYFFALAEIEKSTSTEISQLQELIETIERNYYAADAPATHTLEHILQTINREHTSLFAMSAAKVHCLVGALSGESLTIAYHGAPTAVLWYEQQDRLEPAPIIETPTTGTFLFSEIVEGNITAGDYIYVATPRVSDYLSTDRVGKILDGKGAREAALYVQKILLEQKSQSSFGGIIIRATKNEPSPKRDPVGSEASLNQLAAAARSTEDTLSPPLLGAMSKQASTLWKKPHGMHQKTNDERRHSSHENTSNKMLIGLGRGLVMGGRGLWIAFTGILILIVRFFDTFYTVLTNRQNGRERLLRRMRENILHKIHVVKKLPLVSKIILILACIMTLAFLSSLAFIRAREKNTATLAHYKNIVQAITDKRDNAEARLVYDDKTKAASLLQEAVNLTAELSTSTPEQAAQAQKLRDSITLLQEKIRNRTVVTPDVLADLNSVTSSTIDHIVIIGSDIVAYGSQSDSLLVINANSRQITTIKHTTISNLVGATVPAENDKIVFLTANGSVAEYDPKTQALTSKIIDYPNTNTQISAMGMYNRKLYTIDITNQQIYKHNPTQAGYDKGTPWLKAPASLNHAISLAIDGDLYVLLDNGVVKKFFTGTEQSISIAGVDPTLAHGTSIITESNFKELFMLDSVEKRIIVLDKTTGAVKAQYISPLWKNPSALAVDGSGKTMFVLDGGKLYKIVRQ